MRPAEQKIASEALGRTVTVAKIDFKPWTLELELQDLAVAASNDGGDGNAKTHANANSNANPTAPAIGAAPAKQPASPEQAVWQTGIGAA